MIEIDEVLQLGADASNFGQVFLRRAGYVSDLVLPGSPTMPDEDDPDDQPPETAEGKGRNVVANVPRGKHSQARATRSLPETPPPTTCGVLACLLATVATRNPPTGPTTSTTRRTCRL